MKKDFFKEVVIIVVGKYAEIIVDLIDKEKYVNEFLIAKKMEITINQTRNILYKLSDYGLVDSERKKDKKKGWYTYFWKINAIKTLEFIKNIYSKKMEQIIDQINSRESNQFYFCKRCGIELSEDYALLQEFTCDECGGIFELKDTSRIIRELYKNKEKVMEKLKLIEIEIVKEREKIQKVKDKEKKAAAKKKVAKKKVAKKKVIKKKIVKKEVVKKTTKKKLGSVLKKVVKKVRKK